MADATQFGHDQLGHILADHLLEVPRFQRRYSWDTGNVREFLLDLQKARKRGVDYFMGTVVFARPNGTSQRRQIVDGQQRLATTAILYIAIRDELRRMGRLRQAEELEKRFLRGYVISADAEMERLLMNGDDVPEYSGLLDGYQATADSKMVMSHAACIQFLRQRGDDDSYCDTLIEWANQLENDVQVLVATASDLPEAYVIFETLNDRGADLTTADLLKNYLFSASRDYFPYVEQKWIEVEGVFDKPDDLVKFIRYHHISRNGSTPSRRLYRGIQEHIDNNPTRAKDYVKSLSEALVVYTALRDADSAFWNSANHEVADALAAYRRFGFEASIPALMAAYATWARRDADKLLIKMAKWSVRAQVAGNLGGGTADEVFGAMALAIAAEEAKSQADVRNLMDRLIPSNEEFIAALVAYGELSVSRAKYLLAMLDKAELARSQQAERPIDWQSKAVTVEHILSKSAASSSSETRAAAGTLGNLALLEKRLNKDLGSRQFAEKRDVYKTSSFVLTERLASKRTWTRRSITQRTKELAQLACLAWPLT